MPLVMDSGRIPKLWPEEMSSRILTTNDGYSRLASLSIAIVNNMPDPALVDTDSQFCRLIQEASGETPIYVKLFSLPGVPRGSRVQPHLSNSYFDVVELFNSNCDAVIITGTEPLQNDLRKEAYWGNLIEVLDWAKSNTHAALLSCLAAHVSVLHSDCIRRHPLDDKRFGVFAYKKTCEHALTMGVAEPICMPHSRWNEVKGEDLIECGYEVLTKASDGSVDLFTKRQKESLFVHFQGHPEYATKTLLREYRRDIKRFLRKERLSYPSMPQGYFDASATELLKGFGETAVLTPSEELLSQFPEKEVGGSLPQRWKLSGLTIYKNLVSHLVAGKNGLTALVLATTGVAGF